MTIFSQTQVRRSIVHAKNPIHYDGSPCNEFFPPGNAYFGRQSIPPDNKWSDGTSSFMAPISHYHLLQSETFHIESGSGIWYVRGKEHHLVAGEEITIPRFAAHTFINIPGGRDPLVILYRYDAQMYHMERRFFANALTYLNDCRVQGVEPSILQLCVFLSGAWMPGNIVPVPRILGDWAGCLINTVFMWICAFIGRTMFGYKVSYAEYYQEGDVSGRKYEGKKLS